MINVTTEQLFSTDLRLYRMLKEAKEEGNIVLKNFTLSGPDEQKLQEEDYGLFIGETSTKESKNANKTNIFDVNVVLTVSSKDTDYSKAKTQIDICTKEVIKLLMKNNDLSFTYKGFNQSQMVISSEYDCKFRKTILSFQESYDWEYEDDIDYTVLFGGVEVNGEEE